MRLLIPIVLNMLLLLAFYAACKHTQFKQLTQTGKQLFIGIVFGAVSAFALGCCIQLFGMDIGLQVAAPLSAGFIVEAPAGIITGLIGSLSRWFSVYWDADVYAQLASAASPILVIFMAAGLIRYADNRTEYRKDEPNLALAGMEGVCFSEQQLKPGNELYLYTAGVTEGHDSNTLSVNPTMDTIPQVAAFVEDQLEKLEVPMGVCTKLMVALDEICSNIVKYSGASEAQVCVIKTADALKLIFRDNGKPYNPLDAQEPDITASLKDRAIGGLGIFMVRNMMDHVEYEYAHGMNQVTLSKKWQ